VLLSTYWMTKKTLIIDHGMEIYINWRKTLLSCKEQLKINNEVAKEKYEHKDVGRLNSSQLDVLTCIVESRQPSVRISVQNSKELNNV
jgi:hypothetical protein